MKVKKIHSKKHDVFYHLSSTLYNILKELGVDINTFRELKMKEGLDYFDIGSVGYISYLTDNRIERVKENDIKYFNNKFRQESKIGRLISFRFNNSTLERIVNRYKVKQKLMKGDFDDLFRIVEGNDIKTWYNIRNYYPGGGQLNSSCMRNVDPDRFNIYAENPEVCKMLILLDERSGRLLGRALVWKTVSGRWFVDRPYCRFDDDRHLFDMYARHKGHLFYDRDRERNLTVQLTKRPKTNRKKNPYIDTFRYYNRFRGSLNTKPVLFGKSFRAVN